MLKGSIKCQVSCPLTLVFILICWTIVTYKRRHNKNHELGNGVIHSTALNLLTLRNGELSGKN